MPIHVVKQGECLSSIADQYKYASSRTIYHHADNSEFRRKRPNPNVIYPGDEIFVPDEPKRFWIETGRLHTFQLKEELTMLRLVLRNSAGQPLKGTYELNVAGTSASGEIPENGLLEEEIPAEADSGELKVKLFEEEDVDDEPFEFTWQLQLGHLDPEDELTGVQARLKNLGFDCDVTGSQDEKTEEAARQFQDRYGIEEQDPLGPITKQTLLARHGA